MKTFQHICASATQPGPGIVIFLITWIAMVALSSSVVAVGYSFFGVLCALLAPFFATEFIIHIGRGSRINAFVTFVAAALATDQLVMIFTAAS